jgi:hypothetical protein
MATLGRMQQPRSPPSLPATTAATRAMGSWRHATSKLSSQKLQPPLSELPPQSTASCRHSWHTVGRGASRSDGDPLEEGYRGPSGVLPRVEDRGNNFLSRELRSEDEASGSSSASLIQCENSSLHDDSSRCGRGLASSCNIVCKLASSSSVGPFSFLPW